MLELWEMLKSMKLVILGDCIINSHNAGFLGDAEEFETDLCESGLSAPLTRLF